MTVQPTDLLFVQRGTTCYKVALKDKAKLQPGDLLFVMSYSLTHHKVAYKNRARIFAAATVVVGRGNTVYKTAWFQLRSMLS